MERFVVADASPLIGLAAGGAFELLRRLFGTLTITRLVKDEVLARGDRPGARELAAALREGWIRVTPTPLATWRFEGIDAGEASTIAVAGERDNALVLMDDVLGSARAKEHGLDVLDVAGILLEAKRAALIDAVRPLAKRLVRGGFTLSAEAHATLLAAAGEADG
jgi:predicted nucleic acid-binding protein